MGSSPRILVWDLETMANRGWYFGKPYDVNIAEVDHRWHLLMIGWKWLGEKQVNIAMLPDYKGYKQDKHNELHLAKLGWELLNEADIVVAHNGNSFDQKVMMASIMRHRLGPPSPYKQIDTKNEIKKVARFDSNKLDDLGDEFSIGRKKHHIGFPLWLGCDEGDPKMWRLMADYCKQDVRLLERLYLVERPYITNHPNVAFLAGRPDSCPSCGVGPMHGKGYAPATRVGLRYRIFQCRNCGAQRRGTVGEKPEVKPSYV